MPFMIEDKINAEIESRKNRILEHKKTLRELGKRGKEYSDEWFWHSNKIDEHEEVITMLRGFTMTV